MLWHIDLDENRGKYIEVQLGEKKDMILLGVGADWCDLTTEEARRVAKALNLFADIREGKFK